ncbi:hypothetical protein D3C73_1297580 [compost metagenome]
MFQGQQDAARAGTGQPGNGGYFGQRHLRTAGAERPDHRQAAREGLHVAVTGLLGVELGHPVGPKSKKLAAGEPFVAVAGNAKRWRNVMRRLALTLCGPHETMFFSRTKVLMKNKL